MIDIGVNLTNKAFKNDMDDVIQRAIDAGVEHIVVTGTGPECNKAAYKLVFNNPEFLSCTAGVHPHEASKYNKEIKNELLEFYSRGKSAAVGECGLDYNRDFSPRPQQRHCFSDQLELAVETGLPLFMHQRDAHNDFVKLLKPHLNNISRGVVHCFTGTEKELDDYLDMGLFIGITGWICDERRGVHLKDFIGKIPVNRILIETDAPYLTPRNMRPKPRRGRNEPAFLGHIAAEIAPVFSMPVAEFKDKTAENAANFFNITRKAG